MIDVAKVRDIKEKERKKDRMKERKNERKKNKIIEAGRDGGKKSKK